VHQHGRRGDEFRTFVGVPGVVSTETCPNCNLIVMRSELAGRYGCGANVERHGAVRLRLPKTPLPRISKPEC
jgi:hypothetical protein